MFKKMLIITTAIFSLFTTLLLVKETKQKNFSHVAKMPFIQTDELYYLASANNGPPKALRGEEFRKWLKVSVKIECNSSVGSGTIVYHNPDDNYAYIQSCGHFWEGNMSAKESTTRNLACNVVVWYQNDIKLNRPKSYKAEVLYYSNDYGKDCSLIRFKPDWTPDYFPLAPANYKFESNTRFHSLGCDGATEVANYDVKFIGFQGTDPNYPMLTTTENNPREGRSGGGLMDDEYYVGLCWAYARDTGNGVFTPIKTIREKNQENGFGWLNDIGFSLARRIPIVDRNNTQDKYPKDYIPIPRH